jgi:hypothetical protein
MRQRVLLPSLLGTLLAGPAACADSPGSFDIPGSTGDAGTPAEASSTRAAATPAVASTTRPQEGARLLFQSGFEGDLRIRAPRHCWGTGCWQDIDGQDERSRFRWPPKLLDGGGRFLMLTDPAVITPASIDRYMFNRVETVEGPDGRPTRALYQEITRNHNGTRPMGTSPTQNEFQFLPREDFRELYVSYRMKLQPDLAQRMRNLPDAPGVRDGGTWRGIFAFKTGGQRPDGEPADNGDYRIEVYVLTYEGGKPYWGVVGDNNAGGKARKVNEWSIENRTVPVPVDRWFKFEIFWRRSAGDDGRVWVAIDGKTIAERNGPNLGAEKKPVNRIIAPLLYAGGSMPIYQWVDDLEVWSGMPPVSR